MPKSVVGFVFLGLQADGQKRLRRSSPNSILFNAEISDFDGSAGIPFDHRSLRQPHLPHQLSKAWVGAYGVEQEVSLQRHH